VPKPRWISVTISSKGQLESDVTYRGSENGVRERMGQVESDQQQAKEFSQLKQLKKSLLTPLSTVSLFLLPFLFYCF
jgi:hypothetical protein